MIRALIKQSDGITGRITWLLGRSAEIAIQDGSEFIDLATQLGNEPGPGASHDLFLSGRLHTRVSSLINYIAWLSVKLQAHDNLEAEARAPAQHLL
jgi:hypothetical protein